MSSHNLRILTVSQSVISKIEGIIGLPRFNVDKKFNNWEVLDGSLASDGLYILHHTESSDEELAGFTRGLVVDIENELIVRRTFGREPTVEKEQISEEENLEIQGNHGTIHKITERSRIVPGLDGLIISVTYHGRKVLYGTHKFVDISNTRSRRPMAQMTYLQQLSSYGGIDVDELFDFTKSYSPHIHYFMLCHEELMVSSKMPYEMMGVYYLGSRRMWGEPTAAEVNSDHALQIKTLQGKTKDAFPASPFSAAIVDNELRSPASLVAPGKLRSEGQYYTLRSLTRAQANAFLRVGYYQIDDVENAVVTQLPGEFVMIYQYNAAGQIEKAVRVNSTSYQHRHEILHPPNNLEWNIQARFLKLMSDAVKPERIHILNDNGSGERNDIQHTPLMEFAQYPPIDYSELEQLVANQSAVYYTKKLTKETHSDPEMAVYNLWLNLLFAAPVSHQPRAFALLTEYYEMLRFLSWYMAFYHKNLEVLTQQGFGLLVSFIRMAQNEVDLKDIKAVHAWLSSNVATIPGSAFYSTVRDTRRAYNELVLDRAAWLVDAVSTADHRGLFELERASEWVRDAFSADNHSVETVERVSGIFTQLIGSITLVVRSNTHSLSGGYAEARDALRITMLAQDLEDFLWFTEALEAVYERGISEIVEKYIVSITPEFFKKLSNENQALYDLFVSVHRTLEEALKSDDFSAPESVNTVRSIFYDFEVTDMTRIQRAIIEAYA